MTKIAMLVAAAVFAASSAGAQPVVVSADSSPLPTARVSFADLNLGTEAGKARLEKRIRAAASGLCIEPVNFPFEEVMRQLDCFNSALADGLKQMEQVIAASRGGSALAAATLTIQSK